MISASLIIAILAAFGSAFILCAFVALVWLYFHPRNAEADPEQMERGKLPTPKANPLVQNPVNPVQKSSDTIPTINHDETKP